MTTATPTTDPTPHNEPIPPSAWPRARAHKRTSLADRRHYHRRRLFLQTPGAPHFWHGPDGLALPAGEPGLVVRGRLGPAFPRVEQELGLCERHGPGLGLGRALRRRALADVLELRVAAELGQRVDEDAHVVDGGFSF